MNKFNKVKDRAKQFIKEDGWYLAIAIVGMTTGAVVGSHIGYNRGYERSADDMGKFIKKLWDISPGLNEAMLDAAALVAIKEASNS